MTNGVVKGIVSNLVTVEVEDVYKRQAIDLSLPDDKGGSRRLRLYCHYIAEQ